MFTNPCIADSPTFSTPVNPPSLIPAAVAILVTSCNNVLYFSIIDLVNSDLSCKELIFVSCFFKFVNKSVIAVSSKFDKEFISSGIILLYNNAIAICIVELSLSDKIFQYVSLHARRVSVYFLNKLFTPLFAFSVCVWSSDASFSSWILSFSILLNSDESSFNLFLRLSIVLSNSFSSSSVENSSSLNLLILSSIAFLSVGAPGAGLTPLRSFSKSFLFASNSIWIFFFLSTLLNCLKARSLVFKVSDVVLTDSVSSRCREIRWVRSSVIKSFLFIKSFLDLLLDSNKFFILSNSFHNLDSSFRNLIKSIESVGSIYFIVSGFAPGCFVTAVNTLLVTSIPSFLPIILKTYLVFGFKLLIVNIFVSVSGFKGNLTSPCSRLRSVILESDSP